MDTKNDRIPEIRGIITEMRQEEVWALMARVEARKAAAAPVTGLEIATAALARAATAAASLETAESILEENQAWPQAIERVEDARRRSVTASNELDRKSRALDGMPAIPPAPIPAPIPAPVAEEITKRKPSYAKQPRRPPVAAEAPAPPAAAPETWEQYLQAPPPPPPPAPDPEPPAPALRQPDLFEFLALCKK